MRHEYIIYDGRALFMNTDDCQIMEAAGPQFTRRTFDLWKGTDVVLVQYDTKPSPIDGEQLLENEKVIGPLALGFDELIRRIKEGA